MNYILVSKFLIMYFFIYSKCNLVQSVDPNNPSNSITHQDSSFVDLNYNYANPNTASLNQHNHTVNITHHPITSTQTINQSVSYSDNYIIPLPAEGSTVPVNNVALQATQVTQNYTVPANQLVTPVAQTLATQVVNQAAVPVVTPGAVAGAHQGQVVAPAAALPPGAVVAHAQTTQVVTQASPSIPLPEGVSVNELIIVNLNSRESTEYVEYEQEDKYKHKFTAKGNYYIKEAVYIRTDQTTGQVEQKTIWKPTKIYSKGFILDTEIIPGKQEKPQLNVKYDDYDKKMQQNEAVTKAEQTSTNEATESTQTITTTQSYEQNTFNLSSINTQSQNYQSSTLIPLPTSADNTTINQSQLTVPIQTTNVTKTQYSVQIAQPITGLDSTSSYSDPTELTYGPITTNNEEIKTVTKILTNNQQIQQPTEITLNNPNITTEKSTLPEQEPHKHNISEQSSVDYKKELSDTSHIPHQIESETEIRQNMTERYDKNFTDIRLDEEDDNQHRAYKVQEIHNYEEEEEYENYYDRIPLHHYISQLDERVESLEYRMTPVEEKIEFLSRIIEYQSQIIELSKIIKKTSQLTPDYEHRPFESFKFKPATSKEYKELDVTEHPSDIKLYTVDSTDVTKTVELETSKYTVKQVGETIQYEWESEVKCTWLTFEGKTVWSHREGEYPLGTEYYPEDDKVVVDFEEAIIMYIKKEKVNKLDDRHTENLNYNLTELEETTEANETDDDTDSLKTQASQ